MQIDPQELLYKFLENEANPEELAFFHSRVKENRDYAEQLQLHRDIDRWMENGNAVMQLQQTLQSVHASERLQFDQAEKPKAVAKAKKVAFGTKRWAFAATIALVLAAGIWWVAQPAASHQELYAQFQTEKPEMNIHLRGAVTDLRELELIASDFNDGLYSKVAPELKKRGETNQSSELMYFAAEAYRLSGDPATALICFSAIPDVNTFSAVSRWQEALIFLNANDIPSCKKVLLKMKEQGMEASNPQVQKLLNKLDK